MLDDDIYPSAFKMYGYNTSSFRFNRDKIKAEWYSIKYDLRHMGNKRLKVSIGVMAYNEERNIGRFLESLLGQKLKEVCLSEILIISSGSQDKTNQIIKEFSQKDPRIHLIKQNKRFGKASAVNLFLRQTSGLIVVLSSADLILEKNTLEKLISHFKDPRVGIVGAHPIPINDPKTFFGFASHLLWKLHHEISKKRPKMGELIAFRNIFQQIPVLSSVDEANIEPLIRGQGYLTVYQPDAIVYNKGPQNLQEFIARRRHIYAGHLATKYEYSYEVATLSGFRIFLLLFKNIEFSWQFFLFTPLVIFLEVVSRFLGFLDYKFKLKNHTIWEVTPSTKNLS